MFKILQRLDRIVEAALELVGSDPAGLKDVERMRLVIGLCTVLARIRKERTEDGIRNALRDIAQLEPLSNGEQELVEDHFQSAAWYLRDQLDP